MHRCPGTTENADKRAKSGRANESEVTNVRVMQCRAKRGTEAWMAGNDGAVEK